MGLGQDKQVCRRLLGGRLQAQAISGAETTGCKVAWGEAGRARDGTTLPLGGWELMCRLAADRTCIDTQLQGLGQLACEPLRSSLTPQAIRSQCVVANERIAERLLDA
jgi:hypothetical protein